MNSNETLQIEIRDTGEVEESGLDGEDQGNFISLFGHHARFGCDGIRGWQGHDRQNPQGEHATSGDSLTGTISCDMPEQEEEDIEAYMGQESPK